MRTFKVMPGRSDVIRSHAERAVLELFNTRMAAVSLSGYIFFGSSVSISDRVRLAPASSLISHLGSSEIQHGDLAV